LIETLLYIAVFSVVVFLIIGVYGIVIDSRVRQRTVSEVNEEGGRIMQMITQTIRNANSINSPLPSANSAVLSLYVPNATNNPTLYYLSGNDMLTKEGIAATIVMNSNRVKITNLKFSNLSISGTKGTVKVEFTVSSNTLNTQKIYQFTQDFASNATVR
jgi:hypothetical protein